VLRLKKPGKPARALYLLSRHENGVHPFRDLWRKKETKMLKSWWDVLDQATPREPDETDRKAAFVVGSTAVLILVIFFVLCGYELFIRPDGFHNTPEYIKTMIPFF
jgi:hypothetical protein